MRKKLHFQYRDLSLFIKNLINLSESFEHFILLNSNSDNSLKRNIHTSYDFLAGIGSINEVKSKNNSHSFQKFSDFMESEKDWKFGYFGYDLKNEIEKLTSKNTDDSKFHDLYFFRPEIVLTCQNSKITFHYYDEISSKEKIESIFYKIINYQNKDVRTEKNVKIKPRTPKEKYLLTVEDIKQQIQLGNIYEMNYCQEFFANKTNINPHQLYNRLNAVSPTPFSCFLRIENHYLISASPERFLKKEGNKIISQPIKGTIKRGKNELEDQMLKEQLQNSEKDRAENMMIVDLVRNDFSKIAKKASVDVEELCKIYPYPQLFQMISTIKAILKPGESISDIFKAIFPMGSMTGAPKLRAMKLIEKYEDFKRGLYSGAVGYIAPNHDFDFNVVIRSILYNAERQYLSYAVGGAITSKSDAIEEFDECMVKALAIEKVLKY